MSSNMVPQFLHNTDCEDIGTGDKKSGGSIGSLTQIKAPLWSLCKEEGQWNIPFVKAALGRGEDVNSKDETNTTALMFSVTRNKNSIVRLLLKEPSVDLNCKNIVGETALHFAAEAGNIEGVRLLLADPRLYTFNHENDYGNTPVMTAINRNEIDVLRKLISHPSISLETRNWRGWSLEEIAR